MFILRLLSFVFLLAAAAALGYDVYQGLNTGQLTSTPLGKLWFELDAPSLNLAQALIERYLSQDLWSTFIVPVLQWPAWLDFVGASVILLIPTVLFRRRKAE